MTLQEPPRAPLAFRVGVVGHRPNRLQKANLESLRSVIGGLLQAIRDEVLATKLESPEIYDASTPVVRALSPLAEGTDRLFAEEALKLGFELCCVMPFPCGEFEKDFAPPNALEENSLERFRALLERASNRFELDGARTDEGSAYGAAGRTVLNQSDLLLVVWDGERQNRRGGTEQTLDEARGSGVPVVWVDAHAPHHWQLLTATAKLPAGSDGRRLAPAREEDRKALSLFVRELLALPKPSHKPASSNQSHERNVEDPKRDLLMFYSEKQPRRSYALFWQFFRNVFAGERPSVSFSVPEFEAAVERDWPRNPTTPLGVVIDRLRPFYAWSDKLSALYANRYRTVFILGFLLAAAAVGMALLPVGAALSPHSPAETVCVALEFVLILIILGLVFQGRRGRWHEKWIDYRFAAELVRHLRLVAPLGGGRPFPQMPAHWQTYGQPATSWMGWYVRAVERHLGLPNLTVNRIHVQECLSDLEGAVQDQITFHKHTERRCKKIEHRLHNIGITLLLLTLTCCSVHLLAALWHSSPLNNVPPGLLTFFCGFFPALGAAMAGISNQGEFRRIAKRSTAMCELLEALQKRIQILRARVDASDPADGTPFSAQAIELATESARLLINEVLDWRVVFLDQPLKPPA